MIDENHADEIAALFAQLAELITESQHASIPAPRKSPEDDAEYLTIDAVCLRLDIARRTFYEWRKKGKAPRCIKLPNGDLRIHRDEFEHWLDAREEDT